MADIRPRAVLRGRRSECEALDRLVMGARARRSGVVVLRGDAGIGKTALLDYRIERSSGCRVARAMGAQSDMELACAGLQQLRGPVLDQIDRLPLSTRLPLMRSVSPASDASLGSFHHGDRAPVGARRRRWKANSTLTICGIDGPPFQPRPKDGTDSWTL
jgi:hypothetical protein